MLLGSGGMDILVSNVRAQHNTDVLCGLAEGITGVSVPSDITRNWAVSTEEPVITRELTGRTILSAEGNRGAVPL